LEEKLLPQPKPELVKDEEEDESGHSARSAKPKFYVKDRDSVLNTVGQERYEPILIFKPDKSMLIYDASSSRAQKNFFPRISLFSSAYASGGSLAEYEIELGLETFLSSGYTVKNLAGALSSIDYNSTSVMLSSTQQERYEAGWRKNSYDHVVTPAVAATIWVQEHYDDFKEHPVLKSSYKHRWPNATESISNLIVAIKSGYNESQLDSTNRRATGSAIIPFNNYWQEVLDNVHRVKMGHGHVVFKFADTMNQVVGGTGRYTIDQVKQLLAYYDPATKAWLNGALHGLGYSINAVIPDPILHTLAQWHEYALSPFHTENERFIVEVAGQLLLARLGAYGVKAGTEILINKFKDPTIKLLKIGESTIETQYPGQVSSSTLPDPVNKNVNSKHLAPYLNKDLPRNSVQERLGGYYEGLSLEQVQLQGLAEDLLLRDKFWIKSQVPDYKLVIERNTGITLDKKALSSRRQLASSLQMQESSRIIAGAKSTTKFRDVDRIVETYGGMKEDWVKISSSKIDSIVYDSLEFETHWVENLRTGQKVEFKTIKIKE
jgi:hypothetical protein